MEDLKRRLSNEKRQKESLEMETVTLTAELEAAKTQLSAAEQASVEVDTERRRLMSKVESLQDSAWRATREAQDDAEVLAKKVAEERQSWDEERSRLEQLLDSGQRRILASMSRMRQTEVESKFESIVARQHELELEDAAQLDEARQQLESLQHERDTLEQSLLHANATLRDLAKETAQFDHALSLIHI